MDERPRSYSMDELERLTGFDRRTISYYVQEGLLPRVGRRGPRTRYPQLFLDRLRFIRRIRDMEDTGEIPEPMTLAQIRDDVFDTTDEATIARVAAGEEDIHVVAMSLPALEMHRDPGAEDIIEAARLDKAMGVMPPATARSRRMWMPRLSKSSPPEKDEPLADAFETEGKAIDAGGHAAELDEDSVESGSLQMIVSSPSTAARAQEALPRRLGELLSMLSRRTGSLGRRWGRRSEHWTRADVTRDITISARNLDEDSADLLEEAARILRQMMRN